MTSVGGTTKDCLLTASDTSALVDDEYSIVYYKKSTKEIETIIKAVEYMQENVASQSYNPHEEYFGLSVTDMTKKFELTPDGILITKRGKTIKTIPYGNILDVYIRYAESSFKPGIISFIENTGISAIKKMERLSELDPINFYDDDNSFIITLNVNDRAEKLYLALKELKKKPPVKEKKANNNMSVNIDISDGHVFEYYCANILENNGFTDVMVTPGSNDQGVDIIAEKEGIRYAFQCKYYSSPLGNTAVQEVNAGKTFYNCHVGVVLTNSTFTPSAVALAKSTGVLLWDGSKLNSLINSK